MRIEQSTIAHTLKRMERDGLIDRLPCPTDGRLVRHWLTPRGRAVQSIVLTGIASVNERAIDRLTETDVAQVVDTLDIMIANLDPAAGHAGKAPIEHS